MELAYFVWQEERDPHSAASAAKRQGLQMMEIVHFAHFERKATRYICRSSNRNRRASFFVVRHQEGRMINECYPKDFIDLEAARKWAHSV